MQSRQRGFTLVEVLIVVALVAAALAITLSLQVDKARTTMSDSLVTASAKELAMLARATSQYYTSARVAAIPSDNTQYDMTVSTLISENLLPANFAMRGGVVGTSVFGQQFRISVIRRPAAGAVPVLATFVVFETGTAKPAALARIGVANTADGILALKQQIAAAVENEFSLPSGAVAAGQRTVRGGFNGFTKDLTSYITVTPTQAVAVVLGNFADLSPTLPTPGGNTAASVSCGILDGATADACVRQNWSGAWVSAPCIGQSNSDRATHYREPTLPANAQNITKVPICTGSSFQTLSPGVPGVGLTFGDYSRTFTVQIQRAGCLGGDSRDAQATETYQSVRLNDGEIFRTVCSGSMPEFDASCNVVYTGAISSAEPARRVKQMGSWTFNNYNGTQTVSQLSNLSTNRFQDAPTGRSHLFYCVPN